MCLVSQLTAICGQSAGEEGAGEKEFQESGVPVSLMQNTVMSVFGRQKQNDWRAELSIPKALNITRPRKYMGKGGEYFLSILIFKIINYSQ